MFGFQTPVIVIAGSGIVYTILLLLTLRKRSIRTPLYRLFFIYLLAGAVWALTKALTITLGLVPSVPDWSARIASALLAVLPVILAVLTLLFFEREGAQHTALIGLAWLAFILLVSNDVMGLADFFQASLRVSTRAEAAAALTAAGWIGFTISALVLTVWDYIRVQRPLHRNRILYWLSAVLAVGLGEGLTMAPNDPVVQAGAFIRMLGILLMAYALLSYYLPSVRTIIRQSASATLITIVTAALFLAGFLLLQNTLRALPPSYTLVAAAIMSGLLSLIIQPLRRAIADLADKFLFGEGYDPARALREYSAAITNILDLNTLVTTALDTMSKALEIPRGALLLTTEREDRHIEMRVIPGLGLNDLTITTAEFSPESPILAYLHRTGQPLSQYEIDYLPEFRAALVPERLWLEHLNMELYVPIRRQSLLVGVWALGGRAGDEPYTVQDLNVLSTLADQTAAVLQNARLVSDLKALNIEMTSLNDQLARTNRRLEKLDAAKTNFIQIASHELRTPLTQVRGYADIMADAIQTSTPTPAQMAQISQGISRATVRLEEIITAMLDVSEIDVQSLNLLSTPLALSTVLRMALDTYRGPLQQRRQTLTVEGVDGLPPIHGDMKRLCQALGNIVGNCIKYTPDGGRIAICGQHLPRNEDKGLTSDYVEITISDSGIGIDAEDQELIFEKFYRVGSVDLHSTGSTKFKGAGPGLGLPIARGIIVAHGGRVWVESPGHDEIRYPGSTFHILLPAMPGASVEPLADIPPSPPAA